MFYAHFVLSKKGPLARIWLAAHWDKKLTRAHVFETNISSSVEAILEPKLKMALRTSGHLLLGVVRIYSRKAKYLLADCNEAFVKIKMAFRPGVVDLPDEANREAAIAAITLPENIHDFEATIADLNEINMNTIAINQSRPEDITIREDFGEINLGRQDDDFGDSAFDEASSREILREADKSYGGSIYRGSGQISLRGGTDFSLRADADMDATLIGSDPLSNRKDTEKLDKHGDLDGRSMDIGLDDNDFGDGFLGSTDDEDTFGGGIDPSLFADALFDDPSAQKQLAHITSHLDPGRLAMPDAATPLPASIGSGVEQTEPSTIATPLSSDTTSHPFSTTLASTTAGPGQMMTESNLTGIPLVSLAHSHVTTASTMHGESTTLITNESEAFALPPISTTPALGTTETKRMGKRKRRLIVDELKSIPSETMKLQMEDTSDITTQLDLAPPTKKLMQWKETGSVDKLFSLPGKAIPSRVLQRLFVCNLHTVTLADDMPEEPLLPHPVKLTATSFSHSTDEHAAEESAELTVPELPSNQMQGFRSPALPADATPQTTVMHKLDAIRELSEETPNQLSAGGQQQPSDFDQVHDAFGQGMADDYDDGHMHDDLTGFICEPATPYMPPPSVLSEAPTDMLVFERELAEADDEAEQQLALAFASSHPSSIELLSGRGAISDMSGTSESAPNTMQATVDSLEERRLEKRSKVLLRMLRAHHQQYGWNEPLSLQTICSGNTKKQAASKFYTILLLRKQGAVELRQEAAYEDIHISRGPNFSRLIEV